MTKISIQGEGRWWRGWFEGSRADSPDLGAEHRLHHRARTARPLSHRLRHPLHTEAVWSARSGSIDHFVMIFLQNREKWHQLHLATRFGGLFVCSLIQCEKTPIDKHSHLYIVCKFLELCFRTTLSQEYDSRNQIKSSRVLPSLTTQTAPSKP